MLLAQELPYFKQSEITDYKYKLIVSGKWDSYWKEIEKKRTFTSNFKLLMQSLICLEKAERLSPEEALYNDWIADHANNIEEIVIKYFEKFNNLVQCKNEKDLIKKTSKKSNIFPCYHFLFSKFLEIILFYLMAQSYF